MESAEIEMLVNELETRVDRLRSLYEQYFMGIERTVPSVPHKDVERRIYLLRKEHIRNTAVRFRFQMLIQRYNTYQSHWQRTCRQIEEGTYKRHRLRAEKRFEAPARAAPQEVEAAPESVDVAFSDAPPAMPEEAPTKPVHLIELDDIGDLDAILNAPPKPNVAPHIANAAPHIAKPRPVWRKVEKTAATVEPARAPKLPPPLPNKPAPAAVAPAPAAVAPAPVVAAPARPPPLPAPPKSPADLSDARLRQLYSQYVQTKRSQNESTASLTYDSMAKSLRESSAKLREKHGKSVDFEVAVKDGKTILKPVVKKTPT